MGTAIGPDKYLFWISGEKFARSSLVNSTLNMDLSLVMKIFTFVPGSPDNISKTLSESILSVLIPFIAGIGYELTKLTAKYSNNKFLRFLIYPGILTQKITTQNPDVKQIEVAIVAVKAVV